MTFNVPQIKEKEFSTSLFNLISSSISELYLDYGKAPNEVIFSGVLGKEIYYFILEKEWNLKNLKHIVSTSLVDKIIFGYTEPFLKKDDDFPTNVESLNNKEISGFPSKSTLDKIVSYNISTSFKVERKIQPKLEIKLIRL